MDARKMTGLEIYKCGIELLIDKLGPAGMMRFFWQTIRVRVITP